MAEEPALDRPTVSAYELNEPDRERRVSPSNECDVRGGALPTVNRAVSGDRVGCGWLMPRLGDVGDNDDGDGYQMDVNTALYYHINAESSTYLTILWNHY